LHPTQYWLASGVCVAVTLNQTGLGEGMERARSIGVFVIPFLLLLYVTPVVVVAIAAMSGSLQGGSAVGSWFLSLLVSPDAALNLFHKVLLPITAGVTVATMSNRRWTIVTVIGLLIAIAISIWLQVLFGIPNVQKNMSEQAGNPRVTSADQFFTLASAFMSSFQESLATYLLVLLGLQAIPDSVADDANKAADKAATDKTAAVAAGAKP
jgi:hypothetical protein